MLGLRFREQIRKHFVFVINRVVQCKHFKTYIRIINNIDEVPDNSATKGSFS